MSAGNGTQSRPARQIFRVPALLAILSMIGLVSALVGDGAFDVISWATLAVPILVIIAILARHRTSA